MACCLSRNSLALCATVFLTILGLSGSVSAHTWPPRTYSVEEASAEWLIPISSTHTKLLAVMARSTENDDGSHSASKVTIERGRCVSNSEGTLSCPVHRRTYVLTTEQLSIGDRRARLQIVRGGVSLDLRWNINSRDARDIYPVSHYCPKGADLGFGVRQEQGAFVRGRAFGSDVRRFDQYSSAFLSQMRHVAACVPFRVDGIW